MNIIEAMMQRRSVRTYDGRPITADETEALNKAIADTYSPFGGYVTIRLKQFPESGSFRPDTYGYISGAVDYFLIGLVMDHPSALSCGFRFEQVVLKAWQMGLGTCWIAATFDGTVFGEGQTWPKGEELRIVSPVGRPADPSAFEKEIRTRLDAANRKPFGQLFFTDLFERSYQPDARFGQALDMLRLAPSSRNSQPWRACVQGDTVHFYYEELNQVSVLDCGIGLCHFVETERFNGKKGKFFLTSDRPVPPAGLRYLVTYRAE